MRSGMIRFSGHPKCSALLYWADKGQAGPGNAYLASYLTISPVPLNDPELSSIGSLHYMHPIMFHEPIAVNNLDKILIEARDRNATIVDCGETSHADSRESLRIAVGEYLTTYLSYIFQMEDKSRTLPEDKIKDLNFKKLQNDLHTMNIQDKLAEITQLTGTMRAIVENEADEQKIAYISEQMDQLRIGTEEESDFDRFLTIVKKPGRIARRISELFIKQFHTINAHDRYGAEECREDITSLFILLQLDELRISTRRCIAKREIDRAINTLEEIYRIKEMDPPFCSGEDLDRFCDILSREGTAFDRLSQMYIDKYFSIIEKRFEDAGTLHEKIRSLLNTSNNGEALS